MTIQRQNIDTVIRIVCRRYWVSYSEVVCASRPSNMTFHIRCIIAYLVRTEYPDVTNVKLASALHMSDHTGITYALKRMRVLMRRDAILRRDVEELSNIIVNYKMIQNETRDNE